MSELNQTPQSSLDFLFEATAEGIELQERIDAANLLARSAMSGALNVFRRNQEVLPVTLAESATEAFTLSATAEDLKSELSEKERTVAQHLAGMALSVRVLEGDGRKKIANTYFSTGAVGSHQQEFGSFSSTERKGMFRAALLGQNVLVLYPQWLTGNQMDRRNLVVPILKDDGEPNIALKQREKSWRDRLGHFSGRSYTSWGSADIQRIRQLATQL